VLSCSVVCVILRLAILVEHRFVTDRQTDRHRAMASTAHAYHRAIGEDREGESSKRRVTGRKREDEGRRGREGPQVKL